VVASLLVVRHYQDGTGCRRTGSFPISPAALGRLERIGVRRAVRKLIKPAAQQHTTTAGGRRLEDSREPAPASRAATACSSRLVPEFRTSAAVVYIGRPWETGHECRLFFSGRPLTGGRRRVEGKRGKLLGTRPDATDTRRRLSTSRR